MEDIAWKTIWQGLSLLFLCLMIWAFSDFTNALSVFCVVLIIAYAKQIFWLKKLHLWLNKPSPNFIPNGSGTWADIFAKLYQQQKRFGRNQAQISSTLDRFRLATSALPDGVVLLNKEEKIEWCNPPAERLLGLSLQKDTGQPIRYLVRHADFVSYLQSQSYDKNIKLSSWLNAETTLEMQLILFGDGQKLLITRDISQGEKLETMRRDFIANVSHELRTPLTVVGGFIETLMDMEGGIAESTRSYFTMMHDQTGRMKSLIEDLLTLSQLENNATQVPDTEIDVHSLLNMIQNEAKSLSQGRHTISLEADKHLKLLGSSEELHSAFGNLVSNAVRYTPSGGEIHMSWMQRGQDAIFSVKDSGIGIEQKHIDRLTERFYRVDRSRSRETGGTGLGLSIVKHILTRHQARLEIESELGKGSTFCMVFPKARAVHQAIPASS